MWPMFSYKKWIFEDTYTLVKCVLTLMIRDTYKSKNIRNVKTQKFKQIEQKIKYFSKN